MYRLAIAVVVSLSLMPTRASALPFKPDKQSFNRYLNQLTWKDGKRREFRDLGGCQKGGWLADYSCTSGYVKISSPMGTELCEIRRRQHWDGNYFDWVVGLQYGSIVIGEEYPCRKMFLGLF